MNTLQAGFFGESKAGTHIAPVIFIMISNHYLMLYSHAHG